MISKTLSELIHSKLFILTLFLTGVVAFLILYKLIFFGILTYGDIPFTDPKTTRINFLYIWESNNMGTSIRQGVNNFRDILAIDLFTSPTSFYFFKYFLPLALIPATYFFVSRKFGIRSNYALFFCSIFALANPVVFGDLLSGQTFWVYPILPWLYYFIIKIYYWDESSFKNFVILALLFFLSYGLLPPILIPLAFAAVILISIRLLFILIKKDRLTLLSLLIKSALMGVIFILLSAPYLLTTSSGQAAYQSPTTLSDYLHNYTSTVLLNTMRLSGNNGNGQVTLGFNSGFWSNIAGYGLIGLICIGLYLFSKKPSKETKTLILIALLLTLLIFLGILHLFSVNPEIGLRLFEKFWLVSAIRNPSKVFVTMLPIFVFILAFSLDEILITAKTTIHRNLINFLCLFVVLIYCWPTLRGDMGLLYGGKNYNNYKRDPQIENLVSYDKKFNSRAILIPADHKDELNYQNIDENLNTIRLGGGYPNTAKLQNNLIRTFNAKSDLFFSYLNIAGIKNVYLKHYEGIPKTTFVLFPTKITYEEARSFLSSELELNPAKGINFDHYSNFDSRSLIYSPTSIANLTANENMDVEAFIAKSGTTLVNTPNPEIGQYLGKYSLKNTDFNEQIKDKKAVLFNQNLVLIETQIKRSTNSQSLIVNKLNPANPEIISLVNLETPTQEVELFIDDVKQPIGETKNQFSIRAGSHKFMVLTNGIPISVQKVEIPEYELVIDTPENYKIDSNIGENLITNSSFEDPKLWGSVGDASVKAKGKADISVSQSEISKEGTRSLLLESSNHKAYVMQKINNFNPNAIYKVSFFYKHLEGESPQFVVWENGTNKILLTAPLKKLDKWQRYEGTFLASENSKDVALYFYSPSNGLKTANLFDDVTIQKMPYIKNVLINEREPFDKPTNLVGSYTRHNPALIEINLKKGKGLVVFNESFHKGWKAFLKNKNEQPLSFIETLTMKQPGISVPENHHLNVNSFANGWWIDSIDDNQILVLEFWPQRLFYIGLIISSMTLLGCLNYLVLSKILTKN